MTTKEIAELVIQDLKQLEGDVWQHYVTDVQTQHSVMFDHIEAMISSMIENKVNTLDLSGLAEAFDSDYVDNSDDDENVYVLFEQFFEEKRNIKDFLSELKHRLCSNVCMMVEGEVFSRAADFDLDAFDKEAEGEGSDTED